MLSWAGNNLLRRPNSSPALSSAPVPPVSLDPGGWDAQQGLWLPRACGPLQTGDSGTLLPGEMELYRPYVKGRTTRPGRPEEAKQLCCCTVSSAGLRASREESKARLLHCLWVYPVAINFLHILWRSPLAKCLSGYLKEMHFLGPSGFSWPAETTAYCAAQYHLCFPENSLLCLYPPVSHSEVALQKN